MAKMSDEQLRVLEELEHARIAYDKFNDELNKEIAARRWEARAHTRDLVRKARAHGVPYRRIGIALDTADHQTLKYYEADKQREKL